MLVTSRQSPSQISGMTPTPSLDTGTTTTLARITGSLSHEAAFHPLLTNITIPADPHGKIRQAFEQTPNKVSISGFAVFKDKLGFSDAHSCILWRFYSLALARLRVTHNVNDNAKVIAQSLFTALHRESASESTQTIGPLTDKVESLILAGLRYENIVTRLGIGSLFLLGQDIGRLVWEKWLPKNGALFEHAMSHLDQAGVVALGKTYEQLAEKIVRHLMNDASTSWIAESGHQIQRPQKTSRDRRNSITEPATKRPCHGEKADMTVNCQSRAELCDQLAANPPSNRTLNSELPAWAAFNTDVREPAISADSSTSKSNLNSSNTLRSAADDVVGSKHIASIESPSIAIASEEVFNDGCRRDITIDGQPEMESSGRRWVDPMSSCESLSRPASGPAHNQGEADGITHNQERVTWESTTRDGALQLKGAREAIPFKMTMALPEVCKLELVLGAQLFRGMNASCMRQLEKESRCISYTETLCLHPSREDGDWKLEIWWQSDE
ncbi:hypothetical protein SBOR_0383 [Sclerotinia borealis F-4128]|uniref:Uncharacterized protein n=1 Tax=Sclerotinia borealis (strain F-4128) TaxID=1432307 RepID=W9CXB5_SCLBF|nr:hypothetical protein SBOR_0383 [Sclerotinia borealis F-4128]